MTRFFVYFFTASLVVAGGLTAGYYNPDQVPPELRPTIEKVAAWAGLPPLVYSATAAVPKGSGAGQGRRGPQVVAVEASPVKVDEVRITINAVGSLLADEAVTVAPEISGRVAQLHFKEGGEVEAGAPLVTLDDSILKAELASSQSALKLAQANFKRADTLVKQNAGTLRARDEAVAGLESSRAAADLAQARLDKTLIRAPFSGILGLRGVSVGEYVNAGDAIVTLQNIDPIKVDFRIPETHLAHVRVGQKLQVKFDALPGQTFDGEIYAIDPQVDINGRALKLRARVANRNRALKPGLFARVEIVAESRDAIIVPESALTPVGDQRFVYVVRDGKAVRVPVVLGHRMSGEIEVIEGLEEGDIVVTAGQQRLRDGAAVEIVSADARA